MQILAKEAIPGGRYFSNKGRLVEMAQPLGGPSPDNPLALRRDRNGDILFHVVLNPGTPEESVDRTRLHPMSPSYVLELSDISGRKVEEVIDSGPARRGRKKLPGPWEGDARDSSLPGEFLEIAKAAKLYIKSTDKYFIVGYGGKNLFAVFRGGALGVTKIPIHEPYRKLPFKKSHSKFMPFRLPLQKIIGDNLFSLVKEYIHHVSRQAVKHKDPAIVSA